MKNENKKNTRPEANAKNVPAPDAKTLKTWLEHDLRAASYFLHYLEKNPDLIDKIVNEMMEETKTTPNLKVNG